MKTTTMKDEVAKLLNREQWKSESEIQGEITGVPVGLVPGALRRLVDAGRVEMRPRALTDEQKQPGANVENEFRLIK